MSFVNKKTRAFMDRGDLKPERRRSEARMKRYPSTIDIRAWCDFVEDRRQHILELVVQNIDKCMGKLIPIETILDILLGKYKKDIENLKKCLKMLYDFVKNLGLSPDEKRQLMKIANSLPCRDFIGDPKAKLEHPSQECVAKQRHEQELAEVEALIGKGKYTVKMQGPGKMKTRIKGIKPGFYIASADGTPVPGGIKVKAQNGRAETVVKNVFPTRQDPGTSTDDGHGKPRTKKISAKSEPLTMPMARSMNEDRDLSRPASRPTSPGATKSKRSASSPPRSTSRDVVTKESAMARSGSASPKVRPASPKRASPGRTSPVKESPSRTLPGTQSPSRTSPVRGVSPKASKPKTPSNLEANIGDTELRDQLAAREALCNELQVNIEKIKSERDGLQQKLSDCLKELENFKKLNAVANPALPSSCQEEIEALEVEIKLMRSGNPSPEQEAELIKKEVEVLKRYCTKLKTIEDENDRLKKERDNLKSQMAISVSTHPSTHQREMPRDVSGMGAAISAHRSEMPEMGPGISAHKSELPMKVSELGGRLEELEEITKERDALAKRVKELENELKKYEKIPEEIETLRQRSGMLDKVLEERDVLSKKASQIKEMENEINTLRKSADRVEELEHELKVMNKYDRNSGAELRKSLSKCNNLERELSNVHSEKEAMARRLESMKRESDSYKCRAKECEMLKLERDRLTIKLNELSDIQMQYDSMVSNLKMVDSVKAERDMYKQKYEEVLKMECQCEILKSQVEAAQNLSREKDALQRQVGDLESCICEQETEIKRLVCQVDNMARNKDDSNNRVKDALANMRAEIEKKDNLIAESEEKIAAVQSQIRNSLQGASNEAAMWKKRVNEMEMQMREQNCYIKCLENRLKETDGMFKSARGNQMDNVESMKRELEAAKAENKKLQEIAKKMMSLSGDEHVKKMLKQSECAVKRVVEELGKQYREWDNMRNKHQKTRQSSPTRNDRCCCRPPTDFPISASCEKLKEEMDIIQREKEKLEQIVKQMQGKNINELQYDSDSPETQKGNVRKSCGCR